LEGGNQSSFSDSKTKG